MKTSFRQFMRQLIDYAGLFPPARLDLDPAIRNYARYRLEEEAWMLGRFIIPAGRLKELEPYGEEFFHRGPDPFRFSVLISAGSLAEEISEIRGFLDRHGASVAVEVVEVRLPEVGVVQPADTEKFLQDLDAALTGAELAGRVGQNGEGGLNGLEVFVEAPTGADGEKADSAVTEGIARFGSGGGASSTPSDRGAADASSDRGATCILRAGYKLRCGGLESAAVPTPDRIARVLTACIANNVAVKCTAGLHHPLRRFAEDMGVMQHGFLNVFGAGILALCRGLSRKEIERCILDEDAAHFTFTEEGFSWLERTASAAEVEAARQTFMTGFGSCSFEEPRQDLRRLDLLV